MTTKLTTSILPRVFALAVLGVVALPAFAMPAHAESGPESGGVQLTKDKAIRFRNLDLDKPKTRAALLAKVEEEVRKICKETSAEADRAACETGMVASSLSNAAEPVRKALTLAQSERELAERTGVAQAMR
jgi:UrcA family protein